MISALIERLKKKSILKVVESMKVNKTALLASALKFELAPFAVIWIRSAKNSWRDLAKFGRM